MKIELNDSPNVPIIKITSRIETKKIIKPTVANSSSEGVRSYSFRATRMPMIVGIATHKTTPPN